MRALAVLVLVLAACAGAAHAKVDADLRGCWIERRGEDTITMRWFPDGAGWRGDMLSYHPGGEPDHQAFTLAPGGPSGWTICPLDDGLPHGAPCRPGFFGAGHAVEAGADWMELHADGARLRFVYRPGAEDALALFDGARDGCD